MDSLSPPIWRIAEGLVDYPAAVNFMEERVAAIRSGEAGEMIWLLEHPPLYTGGASADPGEVLDARNLPVFRTGRGGRWTYHGPGQRVVYLMLDLARRGSDLHGFVRDLESWLIQALALLGVRAEIRPGRVGVWVPRPDGREDKIAALGVRVRRWVSYHGIALNVAPDLSHFGGIVPCGLRDHGVTSLAALGVSVPLATVDAALRRAFLAVFGPLADGEGEERGDADAQRAGRALASR